jgi:putative RecB family exonuclease
MVLSELRQQPHLSASSINDYVECGMLYKLGRIDRLPMEFKADALEFGTVIHLVLGEFYEAKMIGERMPLKDIHNSFEEHWHRVAEGREDIKYAEGKDFGTLLMQGKDLLTAWYMKLPEDNFKVLAIEEAFSVHIPGVEVPIIGAMDLIEEDEAGTIIITDFKSSKKSYSTSEIDQNQQLTTYQIAAKENGYADREILLRIDCLIKTQKPKFQQYYTVRTEIDEIRLIKKIHQVWEGISKGVFVPNDTSWKCKNCAYKTACDEWFLRRAA